MKLIPVVIGLSLVPLVYAQPDPKTLLLESIANYQHDWRAGMNWACTQTDVSRSDGTNKVNVYEVTPLDGTPYDRLVEKDGRPLTPEERRREDEKFEKAARERKAESPKNARIASASTRISDRSLRTFRTPTTSGWKVRKLWMGAPHGCSA